MEQIDILMATYNGEKYLEKQIDSILHQTYSNFNLIISDDASTDETREILSKYKKLDDRIQVFFQQRNIGSSANFEFLLNKVHNEVYMLCDQDDIWLENKIQKSIENMKANNSDLVFSDLMLIDENENNISNSFWKEKGFNKKIKKDRQYKGLRLNNYVTGCTIASKKTFLKEILPLPQHAKHMIHDYWIAIVVSLKGKISYIEEPTIKYRQHTENQVGYEMKSKKLETLDEIRKMFIEVKIEHFKIFVENVKIFEEKEQKQNEKALKYFENLRNTKKINFKNWGLFFKLYRYENIRYIIANFVILNMPQIARKIYKYAK